MSAHLVKKGLLIVLAAAALAARAPALAAPDDPVVVRTARAELEVHLPTSTLPGNRWPVVVVVPGLNCLPADYEAVTRELLGRRLAVAIYRSDGNEELAAATWDSRLKGTMDALAREAARPQSRLFGELDLARTGIVGHSLGGAVATLAAARDARFRALAVFGPEARDRAFLDRARDVRAATLAIDGSLDRIAPPEERSAVVVERSRGAARAHIVIKDGNHPNCPADFNEDYIRDKGRPVTRWLPYWPFFTLAYDFPIVPGIKPMPGAEQRRIAFPYLGAWLERHVAGRPDAAGWTDGTKARAALAAGTLTKARFYQ